MFYNLLAPYANSLHIANLFSYVTFRSALSFLLSIIISLVLIPKFISYIKKVNKNGQPIRIYAPESHADKLGTPTMGGLVIILSTIIPTLLLSNLYNPYIWLCLFVLSSFGILGFIDDYIKITKNNYRGISARLKFIIQFFISIIIFIVIWYYSNPNYATQLSFPFFKNFSIDLGYFYIPFVMTVIIGSSNAINLTDGLDGLAIGTVGIAISSFALITYLAGNAIYANHLQIFHIPYASEVTILCAAIAGGSIGFLWYNAKPAEIFMGDTGSLSLGATLGTISIITKHEFTLAIIGGVFVIETLSVIIQVVYYKYTKGKRILLMSPLHHHFEKKGWEESKIVTRFWIMAIIFAIIGLWSLKLR